MSGKHCESKPTKRHRHRLLNNLEARKYCTFIHRPGPRDETLQCKLQDHVHQEFSELKDPAHL